MLKDVQRSSAVEEITTTPPTPPPGESESEEAFERFWAAYPDREGGNPKKAARKAWNARRRDGASAEELVQATVVYAGYIRDEGIVGTRFVKRASSFLGPDEEWREWLTPSRTNGKPPDNAVAAWEQVRRMVEEVSLQNLGPAFDRLDPPARYALGELGEVRALKDLPPGAFLGKRREFLRAYRHRDSAIRLYPVDGEKADKLTSTPDEDPWTVHEEFERLSSPEQAETWL